MLAVVEKSLWPSHSWICFMGTPFARRRLAQLWRRSWKRMRGKLYFRSSQSKCSVTKFGRISLPS